MRVNRLTELRRLCACFGMDPSTRPRLHATSPTLNGKPTRARAYFANPAVTGELRPEAEAYFETAAKTL